MVTRVMLVANCSFRTFSSGYIVKPSESVCQAAGQSRIGVGQNQNHRDRLAFGWRRILQWWLGSFLIKRLCEGSSVSESVTRTWSSPVGAPPHAEVRGKATVHEATVDVPYAADLRIRRSDSTIKTVTVFLACIVALQLGASALTLKKFP